MEVLLLSNFSNNGQTAHVLTLGKELKKQGIRPHLLIITNDNSAILKEYKDFINNFGYGITITKEEKIINNLFNKYNFDIIHAHSSLTFNLAQKLSKIYEIPYVISYHGLGINDERFKSSLNGAKKIICISQRLTDDLQNYKEKVVVIENGIDTEEYSPGSKSYPIKVIYAGRVDDHKRKGFLALGKALTLLDSIPLHYEFFCASNIKPNHFRAKYMGWIPTIAPFVKNTDIIIGTGRAILEGMAAANAGIVLGRFYGGVVTKNKVSTANYLDVSGLSGRDLCYRTIFFDLAKLIKSSSYRKELQKFSRMYVMENYNSKDITKEIIKMYSV